MSWALRMGRGDELAARFRLGQPWAHLVVDGWIPDGVLRAASSEASRVPAEAFRWQMTPRVQKGTVNLFGRFGYTLGGLVDQLNSPATVDLLARVTGVAGLRADPTLTYAGLFRTPPGGGQRVHEDFGRHPITGLWNRVVALVYLSDWSPGAGGELELWPEDMLGRATVIEPRLGRLVLFAPTSRTRHGVRAVAPGDQPRLALCVRYYSTAAPPVKGRSVLRRTVRRPGERYRDVLPGPAEVLNYLFRSGQPRA